VSWRIEQTDALALLRELPENWAQTCVTTLPRTSTFADVLAILSESRRVLRADSTLWLFAHQEEPLQHALMQLGFYAQGSPRWAALLAAYGGPRLLVFTKQPRFFCDAHPLDRLPRPRRVSGQSGVRRAQPMPCKRELCIQLTRRCILAGSSPIACGVCGAPYRRARRPGERTQSARFEATCAHNDQAGCCLVLDPFCHPGTHTPELAHRYGRSFLGITDTARFGNHR
jgi:hypothetical protein